MDDEQIRQRNLAREDQSRRHQDSILSREKLARERNEVLLQKSRESSAITVKKAEINSHALVQRAEIDQQTKLSNAYLSQENIELLHEQNKEMLDLHFGDYERREGVRLFGEEKEEKIRTRGHIQRVREEEREARTTDFEKMKNRVWEKILTSKLLGEGGLSKEERERLQEQARQDLGL